jgi:hypothetical protein
MRKLQPPKKKDQKLKKKSIKHYECWFSNTQKIPCILFVAIRIQNDP